MVQGELFREEIPTHGLSRSEISKAKSFLSRYQLTLSFDKLLLSLIAVVIIFVLTYSFGVEHGKRAMEKRLESLFPTQSGPLPKQVQAEELASENPEQGTVLIVNQETAVDEIGQAAVEKSSKEAIPPSSLPLMNLAKQGSYTVQLVTYMDESLAGREISRLKSKGYEGFVIPSGRYFQVCANYFDHTSKARNLVKQFRQSGRYPDAFVRPVVR